MFAFFYTVILLAAGGDGSPGFYERYLNIPGFEAWKFVNLAIFIAILVYLVKKPLGAAFTARREAIRADLIKAEGEKQAALAELTSTEAKLASLDAEKAEVLRKAKEEADAEKTNIAQQTESEVGKLQLQAESEINRLTQQVKAELRRFSAEESVRLAEEKLRTQIDSSSDAALVQSGIQSMGGLK